ncbi:hypothetical protein H4R34_001765 [Dimargaris verticillata]|uniref:Cytosol aminopeptidase domain-containing protein n=1 Tax=Dimargaris verticillata TaxID=2761393 RepID=A0A9W8B416_9FUNG|nr:hypothetical protein H4R34_001765 [Dimargaris verticillata]
MTLPVLRLLNPSAIAADAAAKSSYTAFAVIFTDVANVTALVDQHPFLAPAVQAHNADPTVASEPRLVPSTNVAGGKLVLSPTGSLDDDTDDIRKYYNACRAAAQLATKAGARSVAFMFVDPPHGLAGYEQWFEVGVLGILAASYVTLVVREHQEKTGSLVGDNFQEVGLYVHDACDNSLLEKSLQTILAIEKGRRIHLDMGYGGPERMTPQRCAQYIQGAFANVNNIKMTVIDDTEVIHREYPLMHAVARCSIAVPRHRPCVVRLEYRSPDPSQLKEHFYLVGKGVTFDTGGADVKANGVMRGMSRDKLGATSVAGLMMTVASMAPTHCNVTAELAFVRNSIGADSYLCDEVIYSRAGKRVLVGNTDAEGRLIMTDLLCQCREQVIAQRARGSQLQYHLSTVATLTGHVIRAYGHYGAIVPNGPATKSHLAQRIHDAGRRWGDPFEISTMRSEDYAMVAPGSDREDACQSNDLASSATPRGHMFPAAFLIVSSGLKAHSNAAAPQDQINYTHLDIAGSAEEAGAQGFSLPSLSGNPVPSLAATILNL